MLFEISLLIVALNPHPARCATSAAPCKAASRQFLITEHQPPAKLIIQQASASEFAASAQVFMFTNQDKAT